MGDIQRARTLPLPPLLSLPPPAPPAPPASLFPVPCSLFPLIYLGK